VKGFFGIVPRFDDFPPTLAKKTAQILAAGLGLGGNDKISAGDAVKTGEFWCFHAAFADCTFETLTFANGTSTGSYAGETLKQGDRIYGQIVAIKLTSGKGIAFRST
jgi:hypothetical protein